MSEVSVRYIVDDVDAAARRRRFWRDRRPEDRVRRRVRVDEESVVLEIGHERLGVRAAQQVDEPDQQCSHSTGNIHPCRVVAFANRTRQIARRQFPAEYGAVDAAWTQVGL